MEEESSTLEKLKPFAQTKASYKKKQNHHEHGKEHFERKEPT